MTQAMVGSLAGLDEVERQLRALQAAQQQAEAGGAGMPPPPPPPGSAAASYQAYLTEAREFFQQDVQGHVRYGSLLKVGEGRGWGEKSCERQEEPRAVDVTQ
jgi:hypothetical protein